MQHAIQHRAYLTSMASPRMCHHGALPVHRERGDGVEIRQQAACLSTLATPLRGRDRGSEGTWDWTCE
jgi:hypothetical protein